MKLSLKHALSCWLLQAHSCGKVPLAGSVARFPTKSETKRRCFVCVTEVKLKDSEKRYENMGRTKTQCQKCGQGVCGKHHIQICMCCLLSVHDKFEIEPPELMVS
ncbi:hypothetical protein Hamer_G008029 [Homarus americanus]|uniref:Uncharacterized protein n=1 Tax=Homarus americanus TaxID=6706 RepID=A0A8J5JQV2_HOMAM|nr:hypothetical protein Hamer_G008029 [Homarus americanus]